MSGRLGNLSSRQQQKLDQFKENLKDVLKEQHDDGLLLQFLRARNFDLKKSSDMFRKHLDWRIKWKVDTILQDYTTPKVLDMYYGGGIVGYDKDGDLVFIDAIGHRDVKGLLNSVKASDLLRYSIYQMERFKVLLEEQSKKLGRRVEQITMISDLEGMGLHFLWRPGMDYLKTASAVFEQNYPETLKRSLLVNAPTIFQQIYQLGKYVMKEEVRQKLKVLGSNWKEEILEYVDADQLPVHWGGTQTGPDGDTKCLHVIGEGHGQKIPESYYMTTRELSSKHCITHDLSKGSALKLQYDVKHPGTILRYEFRTKYYDLAFSIWRQKDDGSKQHILEKQRYNCHMVPEDGHITLEEPGTYIVKFDNSYSMIRGKKLSYCVDLLDSHDEDIADETCSDDVNASSVNSFQ